MLEFAGLPRSTFYYQRSLRQTEDKYEQLKEMIRTIFHRHHGRYGYRRITAEIRNSGTLVNHKTVQRLMGELKLKSLVRLKRYQSYRGDVGRTAPNLLERNFKADRPNEKWTTDVTEFNVAGEKLYLSPVMDLFNGEIITFTTSRRPKFELVGMMIRQAIEQLRPGERPTLHSDQGWQYRMPLFQNALAEKEITQSMSRKANCLDNAAMESFFAVLKTEYFKLNKFASVEELQQGLAEYIHYYNHDRIKLSLGGLSPVNYRRQAATT